MQRHSWVAGVATLAFGLLSLAWTVVEVLPPALGYEDTDNPSVMVAFIRDYPHVYRIAGALLILMALAMTIAVFAVHDRFEDAERRSVTLRTASAFGLVSVVMFVALAGARFASASTLRHVAALDDAWGEAAYLALQMLGTQALGAGGVLAMCGWAVGLSIAGLRTRVVPVWLAVIAVFPLFRILAAFAALLGTESSAAWIAYMLAIPGTTVWFVSFAIVLLARTRSRR